MTAAQNGGAVALVATQGLASRAYRPGQILKSLIGTVMKQGTQPDWGICIDSAQGYSKFFLR